MFWGMKLYEPKLKKIFSKKQNLIFLQGTFKIYGFHSEFTPCSCLNVKELLPQSRRSIKILSHCNGTPLHNHLVPKQIFNHLTKLVK